MINVRTALWMAAALMVGILVAEWARPHPAVALVAVLLSAAWVVAKKEQAAWAVLLTVAMAGCLRYSYVQTAGRGDLAVWAGQQVTVVGTVTTEPEARQSRSVAYAVNVETVNGHPAQGRLCVTQWGSGAAGFGDRVSFKGRLQQPSGPRFPGGYDEAAVLARQSIYFTVSTQEVETKGPGALNPLRRVAVAARIRLEAVLRATLPAQEAALMSGLLFGTRSDLPEDVRDAFKASGVFHLLAVSGGNLAMVIVPLLGLLRMTGVPRRPAAAIAIGAVIFFVFLTGASPSVVRAGCMATLVLLGEILGRERDAVNTLGAAGFVILLWTPGMLFDLGFQLSAGATLGILLFARRIENWLKPRFQAVFGERAGGWLAAGLSVTFAAQSAVEPISLYNFGATSLIAPVANLLVTLFLEPLVWAGSVASLAGLLWLPAAMLINWATRWGLWLLVATVKTTAAVPGAYLQTGRLPWFGVFLWYAGLLLWTYPGLRQQLSSLAGRAWRWRGSAVRPAALPFILTGALILALAGTWHAVSARSDDLLRVTFLDVGQGDAILIESPDGHSMLVDAGPAIAPDPKRGRTGWDAGREVVLPLLADRGIKQLDYLLLTHGDQDHAGGGASVLSEVRAGSLLVSGEEMMEGGYARASAIAVAHQIPVLRPLAGERLPLGSEVVLEILNPPAAGSSATRSDTNANCIAARLVYRQFALLLTCDMDSEVEVALLAQGVALRADVLKVSHHGSGTSSTAQFLAAVRPSVAVLSVGNGNAYGHPHDEVLDRLGQAGARVMRTDRQGSITVQTDGRVVRLHAERSDRSEAGRSIGIFGRSALLAW